MNCSNIFLDSPPRVMKINKWDLIKLKGFLHSKGNHKQNKKDNFLPQNGRKYLQMMQSTRDSSPKYTNSSCGSISKKQTTLGISLGVQWFHTYLAGSMGSIPGQRTKIQPTVWCSQTRNKQAKMSSSVRECLTGGFLRAVFCLS